MAYSYILDGIRSPIGALGGGLSHHRTDDLAADVIKALITRQEHFDPSEISDVILGCANQAGEDNRNIARMALLLAGLPVTVPGETVNRLCASGMSAVVHAHRAIQNADGDLFIAGGIEHMTRGPYVISKPSQPFGKDAKMYDTTFGWRFVNPVMEAMYGTDAMGETAEHLVDKYNISREAQDEFAYLSQMKAKNAIESGRIDQEITPIHVQVSKKLSITVSKDEFPKPDTQIDSLAKLRPAFRVNGTVTAGNSSGLNDGAAALLIASEHYVNQSSRKPLARIISSAVAGVEPRVMGIGPVPASQMALKKAGLSLDDMDIIEINEAFAAQVLSCLKALNIAHNDPRINPNGGSIAFGHPLGMSGSRLVLTAALELMKSNKRYALCTMCIGVGQGYAVILENIN